MDELWIVFLAGFVASFVDGALGMGFGPASSSILLGTGLTPAAVSTTVNLAKVATGLAAAISHWRFDNIDRALVRRLAIPGCVGALIGVTVLANVEADKLKPVLTAVLLVMAGRILWRFSRDLPVATDDEPKAAEGTHKGQQFNSKGTEVVAAAGGLTNGLVGAWGPVVTPFLLQRGLAPRYAVGSVNTAEIAVAFVASGSLLASVGAGGSTLQWWWRCWPEGSSQRPLLLGPSGTSRPGALGWQLAACFSSPTSVSWHGPLGWATCAGWPMGWLSLPVLLPRCGPTSPSGAQQPSSPSDIERWNQPSPQEP